MSTNHRDEPRRVLSSSHFHDALPHRLALARRLVYPLVVVLVRLDGDHDGEAEPLLVDCVRDSDQVCRLDDDRLALILEDTTADGAVVVLERACHGLDAIGSRIRLRAGIAAFPVSAVDAAELTELADRALSAAAAADGHRVEIAPVRS